MLYETVILEGASKEVKGVRLLGAGDDGMAKADEIDEKATVERTAGAEDDDR